LLWYQGENLSFFLYFSPAPGKSATMAHLATSPLRSQACRKPRAYTPSAITLNIVLGGAPVPPQSVSLFTLAFGWVDHGRYIRGLGFLFFALIDLLFLLLFLVLRTLITHGGSPL
jgi:hypothetical protein